MLSGGGARGLAHLGIIKALFAIGIKVEKISGVSTGAVAGAFIAAGFSPEDALKIFVENKLMHQIRPGFNAGIFSIKKWEKILLNCFPTNSFEALTIPLIINATDINACKTDYFSSGELVLPLMASCSIPGIFEPILFNESQYIDGGVLNNLPVEPFLMEDRKIIASHVNPIAIEKGINSAAKILERSVHLSLRDETNSRKKCAHILLEPEELTKFQIFDLEDAEEIFEIGYFYTMARRKELEKLL